MAKKKTFKSLIPGTFGYSQGKLWEGLDYPLFRMNLDAVQNLVNETNAEVDRRYPSIHAVPGVRDELQSISFILGRLAQWDSEKTDIDKRDLWVYLEALSSHFKQLFEMFDEMDAE